MSLISITEANYPIKIDLKYATADNFTGKPVYQQALCFLHKEAITPLKKAIEIAHQLGYTLKIWDAYRPTEAQEALWAHTPNPDYLTPPEKGSPHSRGVAVDLTLLDSSGNPLEMGTPFDDFRPLAHHGAMDISPEAQRNRSLLLGLMTSAGWDFFRNEWWHYQLFNARSYPLLSDKELGLGIMELKAS